MDPAPQDSQWDKRKQSMGKDHLGLFDQQSRINKAGAIDVHSEVIEVPPVARAALGAGSPTRTSTRPDSRFQVKDEGQPSVVQQLRDGTFTSPGTRSSAQSEEAARQAAQEGADRDRKRVSDKASEFSNPGHKERSGGKNRRSGTPK